MKPAPTTRAALAVPVQETIAPLLAEEAPLAILLRLQREIARHQEITLQQGGVQQETMAPQQQEVSLQHRVSLQEVIVPQPQGATLQHQTVLRKELAPQRKTLKR